MEINVPEFLKEKLLNEYKEEKFEDIIEGYSKQRKTTLRINTFKTTLNYVKTILESKGIIFNEVSWYKNALIIENATERDIKKLEIYEKGEIYLQSLSSMIPPIVVNPKEGENILDMTAAPGGKTTQMANLSDNKAMITACEKNKIRADRLRYNLEKQGANHVNLMLEDARKLSEFFSFDKILLDAPCSGSGTISINDSKAEKYYTEELVKRSIKTQKELLVKASNIIKKEGEIIYSTCSILKEENEEVVKEVMQKADLEIIPIDISKFKDVSLLPTKIEGTLCVLPNELYEGFFVAKLKKK